MRENRCEEATELETQHHRQAVTSTIVVATTTTMGVAEDDTSSSLTSHPNANPNSLSQEGMWSRLTVNKTYIYKFHLLSTTEYQSIFLNSHYHGDKK